MPRGIPNPSPSAIYIQNQQLTRYKPPIPLISRQFRKIPNRNGIGEALRRKPYVTIARQLKADAVLEGSVSRAGNHIRISAQLINSGDSLHLWAQTYDRQAGDPLQIQNEISRAIANGVAVRLGVPSGKRVRRTLSRPFSAINFLRQLTMCSLMSTIFSVVEGVLLKPLSYAHADQLVSWSPFGTTFPASKLKICRWLPSSTSLSASRAPPSRISAYTREIHSA